MLSVFIYWIDRFFCNVEVGSQSMQQHPLPISEEPKGEKKCKGEENWICSSVDKATNIIGLRTRTHPTTSIMVNNVFTICE